MWKPLREREKELDKSYPDIPPKALLLQHMRKNASVNCDDLNPDLNPGLGRVAPSAFEAGASPHATLFPGC